MFCGFTCSIDAQGSSSFTKREEPIKMTTSIVIPCAPQHFGHIFGLLYQYEHQTCIPDQIVSFLSESECMSDEEFLFVENYNYGLSN